MVGKRLTKSALLAGVQDACGLEGADRGRDECSSGDERSGQHFWKCVSMCLVSTRVNTGGSGERRVSNLEMGYAGESWVVGYLEELK